MAKSFMKLKSSTAKSGGIQKISSGLVDPVNSIY
jgi:hypothetical protein